MKAKSILILLSIVLILASCRNYHLTKSKWRDISIDKTLKSHSSKLDITTTVDKYSISKKWFYGSIEISNLTKDTLLFNFNQALLIDSRLLTADYNFLPVSWASEAFIVLPESSRTWRVVWKNETPTSNYEGVAILIDTLVSLEH